jgi:hypothetical protein
MLWTLRIYALLPIVLCGKQWHGMKSVYGRNDQNVDCAFADFILLQEGKMRMKCGEGVATSDRIKP